MFIFGGAARGDGIAVVWPCKEGILLIPLFCVFLLLNLFQRGFLMPLSSDWLVLILFGSCFLRNDFYIYCLGHGCFFHSFVSAPRSLDLSRRHICIKKLTF